MTDRPTPGTPDFVAAWRAADRAMRAWPRPADLDARVLAARSRFARRRWLGPAVAVAVAVLVVYVFTTRPPPPPLSAGSTLAVGFAPAGCRPATMTADLRLDAGCTLTVAEPALTAFALEPLTLRHGRRGIRVLDGAGRFEARPKADLPVVLLVAGARIETSGGRFVVEQSPRALKVAVEEGRVDLVNPDGARSSLRRGDRLNMPQAVPDPEVQSIADLRVQGRYAEAERRIVRLLDRPLDAHTSEVLSYERGTLLAGPLEQPRRACAHWRAHQRRFAGGRYQAVVNAALRGCRSPGKPEGP